MNKVVLITGIKRRSSPFNTDHPYQQPQVKDARVFLHFGDLTDATNLIRIIRQVQPDELVKNTALPLSIIKNERSGDAQE